MIFEVAHSYGRSRSGWGDAEDSRARYWRRRSVAASLALLVAVLLELTGSHSALALSEASFGERPEAKPVITTTGTRLSWGAVDPTGNYLLMRTLPSGEQEYALVHGTHTVPPTLLGKAVGYRVKPATGSWWSAEVTIVYPRLQLELEGPSPTLGEDAFAQKAESRPTVQVARESLSWDAVDPLGAYVIQRAIPGGEPEYAVVRALRATPPAIPGATVGYRVKPVTRSIWSAEVDIDYVEEAGSGGEEPKEAEAPSGESSVVNASPTGPPVPTGGWQVAFADGFGAPLGTGPGHDNFWYPNRFCCNPATNQPGFNGNELEVFNSSQVNVGAQGLELVDTRQQNVGGTGKNYVSGTVNTDLPAAPGYNLFKWTPGLGGVKWAFECVCKLPRNTGEEDPGWWSSDWAWNDELDFFEFWGWNTWAKYNLGITWIWATPGGMVQSEHDLGAEFDLSAAFHRYTTVINANNTVEEFIDGVRQSWLGNGGVLGPVSPTVVPMGLKLSNAVRGSESKFTSGSRSFDIRSIAVYEDGTHAGLNVIGGGIAPGTVVE
jgi:hypothetical protein